MEVDTENVAMDETDALMRANDGGGVITSNVNDDDGAPTVEETYEITTTRRKTIRTSYKIQERVVHFGYYWYRLVIPYDGLVVLEVANADYVKFTKSFRCGRFSIPRCNVFSVGRSDEREDPPSRLSSHVRQTTAILRHCQDDDFRTGNELASSAETTAGNVSLRENVYERTREIIRILPDGDKNEEGMRENAPREFEHSWHVQRGLDKNSSSPWVIRPCACEAAR
ncbi:hypothetical protein G5I_05100 [Acromyrmex echinatior]|uniref:Uncharacterized protein n=1 Tax=Acromyrmex echinatior TaxID=103372 RepID=F4WHE0_ACREC|nr:hypothetical protein G5I_05100 [Acromyrmex echinatior]